MAQFPRLPTKRKRHDLPDRGANQRKSHARIDRLTHVQLRVIGKFRVIGEFGLKIRRIFRRFGGVTLKNFFEETKRAQRVGRHVMKLKPELKTVRIGRVAEPEFQARLLLDLERRKRQ